MKEQSMFGKQQVTRSSAGLVDKKSGKLRKGLVFPSKGVKIVV